MDLDVDCGCFGPEDPEGKTYAGIRPTLYRDFVFVDDILLLSLVFVIGMVGGNFGMVAAKDKFEAEVDKENAAVKLVREVQRGDYDVVTSAELKQWIDSGKAMVILDTMPYGASYKKQHVLTAVQFLFPIPGMDNWDAKETDGKRTGNSMTLLGLGTGV